MLLFRAQSIKAYCCVFKTGSKFVPSICNSNEIGECICNDSKNRHQADLLVSWCNLTAIQNGQYNFERGVMKGGGGGGGGGRLTIIVGVVVTNGEKNSFSFCQKSSLGSGEAKNHKFILAFYFKSY